MHAAVPRMSGSPAQMRNSAPDIGQHNAEIYGAIGISEDDLNKLSQEGVV